MEQDEGNGPITITYMSGPHDGMTLQWERPASTDEMILTIGRRGGCDILLDYDSQVSRLHARVVFTPAEEAFYLEDAGSRNGTYIGSDRLDTRAPLVPGTIFRVGRTWLRLDKARPRPERNDDNDEIDDNADDT